MSVLLVSTVFLLELGLGCLLLLPFFDSRDLTRGFFALHGGIAALSLILASSLDYQRLVLPDLRVLFSLVALSVVGTALSGFGFRRVSHGVFWVSSVIAAIVLVTLPGTWKNLGSLGVVWFVSGAILLAVTTIAMNLGHWYLVTKDLHHRHLLLWSKVYLGSTIVRSVLFFVVITLVWNGAYGIEVQERLFSPWGEGFFLAIRFLWGILGTTTLAWFVLKTARMRSNQAATGLLYVALVFAMVGELLAAYLTVRNGVPL